MESRKDEIKFRWHSISLEESMKTVRTFHDLKSLEDFVKDEMAKWGERKFDFDYKYVGYDDRIKWHTWYVCLNGNCVGMAELNCRIMSI